LWDSNQKSKLLSNSSNDLELFYFFLSDFLENVNVYSSDFLKINWIDKPVEIIHIDIAKTLPLWLHLWKLFSNCFIPGKTYIIHQDFERARLPWLSYSLGAILPYIEFIEPSIQGTVYFRLLKNIPNYINTKIILDDFNLQEKINLIVKLENIILSDNMIGKFNLKKTILSESFAMKKAYCHFWFGNHSDALEILDSISDEYKNKFPTFIKEITSGNPITLNK